jgi:hypothetical protein
VIEIPVNPPAGVEPHPIEKALAKSPLDGVTVAKSQGRLSFKGVPQEWTAEFVKRVGEAFRAHETDRAAERDA